MDNKVWVVVHIKNSEDVIIRAFSNEVDAKVFLANYVLNYEFRSINTQDLRLVPVDVD